METSPPPLLKTPTFLPLLGSRFCSSLAKQIQSLAVMWQIYEITRSPLALGFIGFAEAVPYVLVGLWAGFAADRHEKKKLIMGSLAAHLLCAAGLWALSYKTHHVLPVYLVLGVASIVSSLELPSSSSYLQMLVHKDSFSRAAAWNLTQYQVAVIAGPIIGGLLVAHGGAALAFAVSCALFLGALVMSACLKKVRPQTSDQSESAWRGIVEGLKFLTQRRVIFACMVLDMLAVLFGDVIAILPVFALSYGVGPLGLGFLRAAPALGACLTSILEAVRPFIRIAWTSLLKVVVVFGVSIIAFALSGNFYLAMIFLAISGLADGVSVIVRQSIYQANTPDHLRGRVASVSGIFIRISNELGAFESGLAAHLLGTVPSVLFGGGVTLLVALGMWLKYGRLEEKTSATN